jgi:hypothetical protein
LCSVEMMSRVLLSWRRDSEAGGSKPLLAGIRLDVSGAAATSCLRGRVLEFQKFCSVLHVVRIFVLFDIRVQWLGTCGVVEARNELA